MPRKRKIDVREAHRMKRNGKTLREIAAKFNCSTQSVSEALQKLNHRVVADYSMTQAHVIVDQQMQTISAFQRSVSEALNVIDLLSRYIAGDPAAKLQLQETRNLPRTTFDDPFSVLQKFCLEVRKSTELQSQIYMDMAKMKNIANFQQEVLKAIGEENPDCRRRIIQRLRERRALGRALDYSGGLGDN